MRFNYSVIHNVTYLLLPFFPFFKDKKIFLSDKFYERENSITVRELSIRPSVGYCVSSANGYLGFAVFLVNFSSFFRSWKNR